MDGNRDVNCRSAGAKEVAYEGMCETFFLVYFNAH